MFKIVCSFLLINIAGCTVVKYEPDIDSLLSNEGHEFLSKRNLSQNLTNEYNSDFTYWYTYKNIHEPVGEIEIVGTNKQNHTEGFQCFEPMMYFLSLGLIPTHCVGKHELIIKFNENGVEKTITKKIKETTMGGWFPLFLLFSPNWEYDNNANPYERAFIDVINDEAKTYNLVKLH